VEKMSDFWWSLPSNCAFIEEVVLDLREGRNVFLLLPEVNPNGLYQTLSLALKKEDLGSLQRLSAVTLSKDSPIQELFRVYDYDIYSRDRLNVASLADCESFQGRIIWLEDLSKSKDRIDDWLNFFKQYSYVCGNKDLIERSVFCVPIVGQPAINNLPFENLLTHHWWWGKVSSFDLQFYVANKLSGFKLNSIERNLAISVIASICGYDPKSADLLCGNLSEPYNSWKTLLKEEARMHNWDHTLVKQVSNFSESLTIKASFETYKQPFEDIKKEWVEGIVNLVDGRLFLHPAAAAMIEEDREINKRIWSGQLRVLLPIIDEYRIKIMNYIYENYNYDFKNILKNKGSIIEIGDIKYCIDTDRRLRKKLDNNILSLIKMITKVRNELAHLGIISNEQRKQLVSLILKVF
jgi:hypothetical protein